MTIVKLLQLLILCSSFFAIYGHGILCYQCNVLPSLTKSDENDPLCSKFDGSAKFQVYCPKSTWCFKKIIYFTLGNGSQVVTSIERGCASQKHAYKKYNFDTNIWVDKEEIVEQVYQPGCVEGEDKGTPNGPSDLCYCRLNFCNNSYHLAPLTTLTTSLIVSLLIKLSV